jgi:hypothetical protein
LLIDSASDYAALVAESLPAFQRNAPEKTKSAAAADRSYAVIEAKAHRLIRESRGTLTMGQALALAREQPVTTTAKATGINAVAPKPRTMLIRGCTGTYVE